MDREEIREEIDKEVAWELCLYCRKHDQDPNPDNQCLLEEPCEASMVTAKTIRKIYHSQGVAIKVEGELPITKVTYQDDIKIVSRTQQDMLKASYTTWKPLIKE